MIFSNFFFSGGIFCPDYLRDGVRGAKPLKQITDLFIKVIKMKFLKSKYVLIIPVVILIPLLLVFCYNLGRFTTFGDTMRGTINQYLPLFPLFLVSGILLYRALIRGKK